MLSGRRKKDYEAQLAADSLAAQAVSLGEAPATEPIAEAAFDPGSSDADDDAEAALGNLAYKTGGIEIKDIEEIERVIAFLRLGQSVALMCLCADVAKCHRLTLAEEVRRRLPEVQIVHL